MQSCKEQKMSIFRLFSVYAERAVRSEVRMGSFWGHIDEGIFFTLLALWWTFHACWEFIEVSKGKSLRNTFSFILSVSVSVCLSLSSPHELSIVYYIHCKWTRLLKEVDPGTVYAFGLLKTIVSLSILERDNKQCRFCLLLPLWVSQGRARARARVCMCVRVFIASPMYGPDS